MGAGSPVSRITHYRGRSDGGGVDDTPTWIAAEDTSFGVTVGTAFRIRIGVENTGTANDTINVPDTTRGISRCGYSSLAYSSLGNVINAADASTDIEGANVTVQRLTSGTGTFANGSLDENEVFAHVINNGNFTECEFGVVLTGGASTIGVGGGETWTFQLGGLTNASLNVPTFTTPDTNGSDFQHGAQLGGTANATADSSSISMTTEAAASSGNLVVVAVAVDNNQTTDGDEGAVSSLTIDGVSATKAIEFCNGQGAAQAGCTVSVWYLQLSGNLSAGSTITANFTNNTSRDTQCIQAREYIVASGKTVSVEATNTVATDGTTQPSSLDATTSNIECLRICAHAYETGISDANVANSLRASNSSWSFWWTSGSLVRGSITVQPTRMTSIVEGTVSTGTGKASQIGGLVTSGDWASAYVAFKATAANVLMGQALL